MQTQSGKWTLLTERDIELVKRSLGMYIAWIETNNPMITASDIRDGAPGKINDLLPIQRALIEELTTLRELFK